MHARTVYAVTGEPPSLIGGSKVTSIESGPRTLKPAEEGGPGTAHRDCQSLEDGIALVSFNIILTAKSKLTCHKSI